MATSGDPTAGAGAADADPPGPDRGWPEEPVQALRSALGVAAATPPPDDRVQPWRRLFAEVLGTFFLVLVSVGPDMVNARFGGDPVSRTAAVVAPGLMVASVILFMGSIAGAHLNPAVTVGFAMRRDFPWRRVPGYVVAQFTGGVLATGVLVGLLGGQHGAGLTRPAPGFSAGIVLIWELVLTFGLVSTVLGTSSGAQNVGPLAAVGVGGYIALAGLWASPVSGASMNPVRSLAPALVVGDWSGWWAYLVGPLAGAVAAVVSAYLLRGPGGHRASREAAQGRLAFRRPR